MLTMSRWVDAKLWQRLFVEAAFFSAMTLYENENLIHQCGAIIVISLRMKVQGIV